MGKESGYEKKKPCEICGSLANELLIMTCFRCRDSREHTYCARVSLQRVPSIWLCEECRSSSSIDILADRPANSRINQVECEDSNALSRTYHVEQVVNNKDSIEADPSSSTNQVVDNAISLRVGPHVHMYATSEESSPDPSAVFPSSIVFKSVWERSPFKEQTPPHDSESNLPSDEESQE